MAFPRQLNNKSRSLRWSGGGLLVLASLGLHGVLLGFPLPQSDPTPPSITTDPVDPNAAIDVVRLAIAPEPTPAPPIDVAPPPKSEPVPPRAATAPPPVAPEPVEPAPNPTPAELEPLPPEPPPQTLDDRLRDPGAYAYNQQAKSSISDTTTFYTSVVSSWLEAEGQGITDDNRLPIPGEKLAPIQVTYPLTACLTPNPAEGVIGVVVDTAGRPLKEPVLLDSTGYTVLDDKALELVLQRNFPAQPAGNPLPNPRGYWLPIQVQYDVEGCAS
ncbi:hypothetical protein IQ254_03520 [Nodosilinea sp. LEGE 07088]|uniref:energy transducer TonB n=1 Tax=Nodosilinea sp. LEGE 07088 TaxID=2777968 RepID=UPI001880355F|nr:hypothetical protein [Nodosilinea sp. LEGE 07088]MBE9136279.1 hypothetical protein [Nodosilinea sp. LEGE 07088]